MSPAAEREFEKRLAELEREVAQTAGLERVRALLALAEQVSLRQPLRALPHVDEAILLLDGAAAQPADQQVAFQRERAASFARLGALLQVAGQNERARAASREALDRLPEDDFESRAIATRTLGMLLFQLEDVSEALALLEQASELVDRATGERARALETRLIVDRGRAYYRLGEMERAREFVIEGRTRAREQGEHAVEATCEVNLGNIGWQLGDLEAALAHYREAMKFQRELGSHQSLAISLHNLACVHYETDDTASTLETIDDALSDAEELAGSAVLPRLLLLRGRAFLSIERFPEAARAMRASFDENERQGNLAGVASSASALAEVEARMGNEAASREWNERALVDVDQVLDHMARARCYAGLARAEAYLGRPRAALELLSKVQVEGTDTRSRRLRVDIEMCASNAHEALGEDREALEHYRAGLALERELLVEGSRVRADRLKMLHRLEQGRHREELLADSKGELERRVAERTEELEAKNRELVESIESRASLETQLRHTQKMEAIGRLAGGVAHDFNNLLVVIQGYGERLLRSTMPSELGWEEATQILGAATRASRLTSQLLAFSRRDAYREQVCELGSLVGGMQHMLQRLIGEDVQMTVETPTDPAPVLGDPGRFEQLILDLVVHARDAMPDGGRLELKVEEHPAGTLRLSIWHEESPDSPTPPDFDASPVLGDARAIIERASGELRVESAPGGSRVLVLLPRHAPAQAPTVDGNSNGFEAQSGPRILLVDDEEGVRQLVATSLRALGYRVTEATNGREALQRAIESERSFDLIVCDVVMPKMGGPALYEALRDRGRNEPFLFVSGYTDQSDAFLAEHADEIELLGKPFLLRQLEDRIATILARG
ncbi:MAG: tetratricopeptide repeat protein [Planctomycetes bacterium]|nr:tetratricopeptide repeat protein [Planctomycetota bacterium]